MDTEFVPLPEVDVLLAQHEVRAVTGEDGRFQILPPGPGDYTLVFNKDGYASQELGISVYESEPARVLVTLVPVASHVPYHETRIVFTYTQCWFSAGPAGAACLGLVDYLAGTSVSQDRLTHVFSVQENLGNLLIEIMYKAQSLGKEAIIVVREPGSLYSGAQKSWLLQFGPSPIRAWLVPDQVGTGGRDKFMADPTIKYMALIGGWGSNSTIPSVALHLDFRTQTHFNLFYNRPGPPDFTSLPDQ